MYRTMEEFFTKCFSNEKDEYDGTWDNNII